jgi:ssDNA-binding Zn-finger/Zn-ribbon topoisomerase 1
MGSEQVTKDPPCPGCGKPMIETHDLRGFVRCVNGNCCDARRRQGLEIYMQPIDQQRPSEQCAHENATPDRPEPTSEWTCADCGVRLWLPEQYAQRSSKPLRGTADLCRRLRMGFGGLVPEVCDLAANEIEALQTECEQLRHDLDRAIANHSADLSAADETPACRCVELGYTCPTCCAASVATAAPRASWIDRDGNEHVDDTGLESDKPF